MRSRVLLCATLVFAACGPAQPSEQQVQAQADSARAAVEEGNARWMRYVNTNAPDSLGMLFTADGLVMPPNVPGATGRDSIVARLRTQVIPGGTLTITTQNVAVHGPLAVDRGTFTYTAPAQGRNPAVNMTGKYMAHWHLTGDGWRIVENIWNTDMPAPPAPPPAR